MNADKRIVVSFTSRFALTTSGGIEAVVAQLIPRISALRPLWDVRSVYAFSDYSRVNRIPLLGDLLAAIRLYFATRHDGVTVINGAEYAWPRILGGDSRKRTIIVWHGTRAAEIPSLQRDASFLLGVYAWSQRILAVLATHAPVHVAVGTRTRDEIKQSYAYDGPLSVILNGAPHIADVESANLRTKEQLRILWVGTNAYKKGLDIAIDAVRILRSQVDSVELDIVGLTKANGPGEPWIHYHGRLPREQMAVMYEQASVLCASTRYEACSIAILEAMAYGLPIVASQSVAWMLGAEVSEIPLDAQAFADNLRRVLLDRDNRMRCIDQQFKSLRLFDWSTAASSYVALIEDRITANQ